MRNIILREPPKQIHPGTWRDSLADMLLGALIPLLPWLGAVAIHWWVTH